MSAVRVQKAEERAASPRERILAAIKRLETASVTYTLTYHNPESTEQHIETAQQRYAEAWSRVNDELSDAGIHYEVE